MEKVENFSCSVDGDYLYNIDIECPCGHQITEESIWLWEGEDIITCEKCKRKFKLDYTINCKVVK